MVIKRPFFSKYVLQVSLTPYHSILAIWQKFDFKCGFLLLDLSYEIAAYTQNKKQLMRFLYYCCVYHTLDLSLHKNLTDLDGYSNNKTIDKTFQRIYKMIILLSQILGFLLQIHLVASLDHSRINPFLRLSNISFDFSPINQCLEKISKHQKLSSN